MPFSQPTDISGNFIWYKSTGNNSNNQLSLPNSGQITFWQDMSGSGNNLSLYISGAAQAPQFIKNVINGYPAIRFNGINNYMHCANNANFNLAPSSITIFTLYQTFSAANQQTLLGCTNTHNIHIIHDNFAIGLNQIMPSSWDFSWGPDNGNSYSNVVASSINEGQNFAVANQFLLRADTWDQTSNRFAFYKYGAECATGIASQGNGHDDLVVGASYGQFGVGANFLSGDLIEIVGYNRILSSGEIQTLSSYFFQKYQLQNTLPCTLFLYGDTPSGIYKDFPLYISSALHVGTGITLFLDCTTPINSSLPLFLDSATKLTSNITLYTDSALQIHNSSTLYMYGRTSGNNSIPLYLDSSTPIHSSLTLYTDSSTIVHSSTPLYLPASSRQSGHFTLYLDTATKITSGIYLYTDSSSPIHSSFVMYTTGSLGSQHSMISLYMDSSTPIHSSLPLYEMGTTGHINSNFTLYLDSANIINSGMTLFIPPKSTNNVNMPLYVNSNPTPRNSGHFSLYTQASHAGTHGLYSNLPMYVYGIGHPTTMPLYLAAGQDHPLDSMPLFISGPINTGYTQSYFPLYLANNVSGTGPAGLLPKVKLYTRGLGQLDGASVKQGNMPLYLYNKLAGNTMPMYICAGISSSSTPLYTRGANFAHSGVLMYVRGTGTNNHLSLYTSGPGRMTSGTPLYIMGRPKITDNLNIYVGGF